MPNDLSESVASTPHEAAHTGVAETEAAVHLMDEAADRGTGKPRVVIIGGGFGGLRAAKDLAGSPVDVTLIDRRNHHVFQPLLYQVATAALSPADIAAPIRQILGKQANARVLLAEASSISLESRIVNLRDGAVSYDYLILAPGAASSYFGHDSWRPHAPSLKSVEDAIEIRRRFLLAFERAERQPDEDKRRAELTFVIVGGGPTGVELAGTMAEIARKSIPSDFRAIDTRTARIVLIEGEDRLLAHFHPDLGRRAKRDLENLGVEVILGTHAKGIDADGVDYGDGNRIAAKNVVWAAGVRASPLVAPLAGKDSHDGRVGVRPDLSLPNHPEVFVIGDSARVPDEVHGGEVPGMAQGAMQMGTHAARLIDREVRAGRKPSHDGRDPFKYKDKGKMATIGRAKAVVDIRGWRFGGLPAWLIWSVIHVYFLIGFRRRLLVLVQWAWSYLRFERGTRLITGPVQMDVPGEDTSAGQRDGQA